MKPHILSRHGVDWPPRFFPGDGGGCSCCTPPPPPPPPTASYYSYYGKSRCVCDACGVFGQLADGTRDDYVACSWMIEIDGYANGPQSGSCDSGTDCDNNNGTFVLTRSSSVSGGPCRWISPTFSTTTMQSTLVSGCPICSDSAGARYELDIEKTISGLFLTVRLRDVVTLSVSAYWQKMIGPTECTNGHVLPQLMSYSWFGADGCCKDGPAFITVLPL